MQNNITPLVKYFNINIELITPIVRTKYWLDNEELLIRHFFNKNTKYLIAFGQTPPMAGKKIKSHRSTESRGNIWVFKQEKNKNLLKKTKKEVSK